MSGRDNAGIVGRVKKSAFKYCVAMPLLITHEVIERVKACDFDRREIDYVWGSDDLFNLPRVYRTYGRGD